MQGTLLLGSTILLLMNLQASARGVIADYARSREERGRRALYNAHDLIHLARGARPADARPLVVGLWYPFDDRVTLNQLNMLAAYHLFPARVTTARSRNRDELDCIVSDISHLDRLQDALEGGPTFHELARKGDYALLGKSGIAFEAPSSPLDARTPMRPYRNAILVTAAVLLLLPVGAILRRGVTPASRPASGAGPWIEAWSLGLAGVLLAAAALGWTGVRWIWLFGMAALVMVTIGLWSGRRHDPDRTTAPGTAAATHPGVGRNRVESLAFAALTATALVWISLVLLSAWGHPTMDIAGMGVWGLKAKAFHAAGGVDTPFLADPLRGYCQPGYPVGFPLLLAAGHASMGGVDDWAIKLLPAFFGIGVLLMLHGGLLQAGLSPAWSLLGALLFCTGTVFSEQSAVLEAETLLVLMGLAGFRHLAACLKDGRPAMGMLGAVFLAAASSVKQEGVVCFVLGTGLACLFIARGGSDRDRPAGTLLRASVLAVTAVFVLPWFVYVLAHRLPNHDFSLMLPLARPWHETLRIWAEGELSFARLMFASASSVSWIWVLGTVILVASWRGLRSDRSASFLLASSLALVALFGSVYVFSTYGAAHRDWHMQSNERILLLPTALFLLSVGFAVSFPRRSVAAP
jgi:hypothetical protein